jgi:hypothetical protein
MPLSIFSKPGSYMLPIIPVWWKITMTFLVTYFYTSVCNIIKLFSFGPVRIYIESFCFSNFKPILSTTWTFFHFLSMTPLVNCLITTNSITNRNCIF